jgi:hypothetical protein
MLKQDTFTKTAFDFGCSIGVAKIIGYTTLKEEKNAIPKETYKKVDDEMIINDIINILIEEGAYEKCMRKVLVEERKRNGKTKRVTIYKKIMNWYDTTTSL